MSKAAGEAGISRCTPYDYREKHPEFAIAWAEAEATACDALELEARRRAHDGTDKPVIYKGELMGVWIDPTTGAIVNRDTANAQQIPLTVKEYSDTLLIFLLKAHRPDKFRDNSKVELTGKDGGAIEHVVIYVPDNGRGAPAPSTDTTPTSTAGVLDQPG